MTASTNPGTPAPVQTRIRMEHATHDEQRSFDITVTGLDFESPAKCLAEAMATVFRDPLGVAEIVVNILREQHESRRSKAQARAKK